MNKTRTILRTILAACLLLLSATFSVAQGIQFAQGIDWEQILTKARAEHKYIFVDCYATWCGPCKAMEQTIYTQSEVGEVYNKDFISVKVQMDRTVKDGESIKAWYETAHMLETSYNVNAYPTFLFFDENGNPIHKSIGGLDAKAFIQLAVDAQNPAKQSYSILKNFLPNTLDTADEHGLIYSFLRSGSDLSGKLAVDYLSRIPEKQLDKKENGAMMVDFQSNPDVLDIALNYIQKHGISNNLQFLEALAKQPKATLVAQNYIATSNAIQLYSKPMIGFLSTFTKTPEDEIGFEVFYRHGEEVDKIIGQKGYANGEVRRIIYNAEVKPLVNAAKRSGLTPNFDSLKVIITRKYDAQLGNDVIISSKTYWYKDMLRTKDGDKYWPEYITTRIAQVNRFRLDTISQNDISMNNICWEIFERCTDKQQLLTVATWMKQVDKAHPNNSTYMDTYACLLYKAGQTDTAIQEEASNLEIQKKAVQVSKDEMDYLQSTLDKMKKGEAIWNEKEYQ